MHACYVVSRNAIIRRRHEPDATVVVCYVGSGNGATV